MMAAVPGGGSARLLMSAMAAALSLASSQGALGQAKADPAPHNVPATVAQLPDLTVEQWRDDLRFMVAEMRRRHPNLYHQVSHQKFDAAVVDLDRRIPALNRNEIVVGFMRIAALVGDGHTRVEPRKDKAFRFPSLPVKLFIFDDGVYIRAARPQYAQLIGMKVNAVGGVPIEEAIRRLGDLASGENSMAKLYYGSLYLGMPDILEAVGLARTRTDAEFTVSRNGRRRTVTIPLGEIDPIWPPDTDISLITPAGWIDAHRGPAPLWLQAPLDLHRLIELPQQHAIYAQINMIADTPTETLSAFGARIRERAAATNPRAIILDLRLSYGGNGSLRNGFVRELIKAEDSDTRLFVLTGRGTFSASQFVLDDLARLTDAVIVGEPATSKPTSYGDAYRSTLPNSGISLRTSLLYWQQGQNMDPWTWVDVAAPPTFAAYQAGRDPALEAALNYQPSPPLAATLQAAMKSGGERALTTALNNFTTDPRARYGDKAGELVRAAQGLNERGERSAAIKVAKYASEQFPSNADAYLVLAAFAAAEGKLDQAREAAAQLLRIDPNNRQIRPVLDQLNQSAGRP